MGPGTRARVAQACCSTPRAFGPGPESLMTAGRHFGPLHPIGGRPGSLSTTRALGHGSLSPGSARRRHEPSDTSSSRPVELVEPAGSRTRARVIRDSWSNTRALGIEHDSTGTGSTPRELGHGQKSPERDGQPVVIGNRTLVAWDIWTRPWDLGHGPEGPGTAGRHRGPSALAASCAAQMVDPAGHRTLAQVAQTTT